MIVQATTPTKDFTTSVWFLDTSVVRSINHGGLVRPVIVTITKFESPSWSGDFRDLAWVALNVRDCSGSRQVAFTQDQLQ